MELRVCAGKEILILPFFFLGWNVIPVSWLSSRRGLDGSVRLLCEREDYRLIN